MDSLHLIAYFSRVVHLLQLINLCWHIIIFQSSQFTLGFTLGVVYSMDLDKCIMPCIHHYVSEYFYCPKNPLCSVKETIFGRSNFFSCISHLSCVCVSRFSSVQYSHSVMSNSLWPHGLQHARIPCPSPIPWAYSNSCPSSWWCHPTISSSVVPFSSHLQSFPASGSFQMS